MFPTKLVLFECKFNVDKLLMEEKLKTFERPKPSKLIKMCLENIIAFVVLVKNLRNAKDFLF